MYTAVVLDRTSVRLLTWMLRALTELDKFGFNLKTAQGVVLPHHMTINLGKLDATLNHPLIMDSEAELEIDEIVFDHVLGVCAATVKKATTLTFPDLPIRTMKLHSHITM